MRGVEPEAARRDLVEAEGERRERTSLGVARKGSGGREKGSVTGDAKPGEHEAISGQREHGFEEGPRSTETRPSADVTSAKCHGREGGRKADLDESASVDRAMDDAVQAQREGGCDVDTEDPWDQEGEDAEQDEEDRELGGDFRRRKSSEEAKSTPSDFRRRKSDPMGRRKLVARRGGHFRRRKSVRSAPG